MDYQDFLHKLKLGGIEYQSDTEKISVEWRVGGMRGGSCWGDHPYPIDADDEPEFNVLDQILELICPNISFLQYKNISSQAIVRGEYRDNDYYGNYTDYKTKTIILKNLFDVLRNKGLIS